jgi:hypothetical protein
MSHSYTQEELDEMKRQRKLEEAKKNQRISQFRASTTYSKNSFRRKPVVWKKFKMQKGNNETVNSKIISMAENLVRS